MKFFLAVIFICVSNFTLKANLYDDKEVENKFKVKFKLNGSINTIITNNSIEPLKKHCRISEIYQSLGYSPKKIKYIEGIGTNSSVVLRYQVSKSYDLLITYRETGNGKNAIFSKCGILPHLNVRYSHLVSNMSYWNKIIIDSKEKTIRVRK